MKRILLKLPIDYVYYKGFKKSIDYMAKLVVIDKIESVNISFSFMFFIENKSK
ncbi:unnamed protein product [marine sediment metagenome]|uniref:Uncharacterized protein n=1 Tax=marine sediment metagenome TaxID=412755 RepID=X1IMA0_9ZZZZ